MPDRLKRVCDELAVRLFKLSEIRTLNWEFTVVLAITSKREEPASWMATDRPAGSAALATRKTKNNVASKDFFNLFITKSIVRTLIDALLPGKP